MAFLVIVNADDFGLTPGVNASILACHRAGSVTSASFMANMEAAEEAARLARDCPSLGVGLHFNLTQGRPVAPPDAVASLLDEDGSFVDRKRMLWRATTGRIARSHLDVELSAQLERMRDLGLEPTHFDSHQHVHALPVVFASLSSLAVALRKPVRIAWRWPGNAPGRGLPRRVSEWGLATLTARCLAIRPTGMLANDGLCSVFDLDRDPSELSEASYATLLQPYVDGVVELMVHPAVVDAGLPAKTEITAVSATEDRLLRSPFLRALVESRGARMASYGDVG